MDNFEEIVPFMDKYPKLKLVSSSLVDLKIWNFSKRYDYVQDLNRKSKDGTVDNFYLVVKNGKFGILFHQYTLWNKFDEIALAAEYDQIDFISKAEKSFGAIICKDGKYGMYFWEHGLFINTKHVIPTEFDIIEQIDYGRIKGIKNKKIMYFDINGHLLK